MGVWEKVAEFIDPAARVTKWLFPADLAAQLNPRTVQTPALEIIDAALKRVLNTPDGRLIISMPPQEGKLVADDTPVLTTNGWTTHGELKAGDYVFHPSGQAIRVEHIHAPAEASLKVTFSDHSEIVVHPRHEWTLKRRHGAWQTVETQDLGELRTGPTGRGGRYTWQLPEREALEFPRADLPVDPYTLGVWLGNGTATKAAVSHMATDDYKLPYEVSSVQTHPVTGVLTTYYSGLWADLKAAGVAGDKHIPEAYLMASEDQRRALLAGLIDTDGHVHESGQVSFDNADRRLVEGTCELLRTLGYRAHVHQPTPAKLSSSGIQGKQDMWRVTFTPHDVKPARLERKRQHQLAKTRRKIAIVSVEPVTPVKGRCITVDSPDGLYLVGKHLTPTHNSVRAAQVFPIWALAHNPDLRIVLASYGQSLANRNGRAIRNQVIAHPEVGFRIAKDNGSVSEWSVQGHEGGVLSVGVGAGVTGRSADLVIIDDPHKDRKEADSAIMRDTVWDWWTDAVASRLSPGAPVVVIMTRWHSDDLVGRLLERDAHAGWEVINIPAQADHNPAKGETDPLGREPGEFMLSARGRTKRNWEKRKATAGAKTWASLYQGRPSPQSGGVFPVTEEWARYSTPMWVQRPDGSCIIPGANPGDREDTELVQSWDLTFKDGASSDYVVGQVWLRVGAKAFLLDQVRERLNFTDTLAAIHALSAKWPQAVAKFIEDKANGPAAINSLRQNGVMGLIPIEPEGSKYARAAAISPLVESGNVVLPAVGLLPNVADLLEEAKTFPNSTHDDTIDAMSQAVNRILLMPLLADGGLTDSAADIFDDPEESFWSSDY